MKNSFIKDIIREITKTPDRFLGIFAIVALGVAFFAGLGATGYDMKLSGDRFLDEQRLMDVRVLSTYGFNENDVAAISALPEIESVQPAHSADALLSLGTDTTIVKVHSLELSRPYGELLNAPLIVSGRMPENENEILLEPDVLSRFGLKIGMEVTLESGKSDDIRQTLKNVKYVICGSYLTPYYISRERGTSSIGSGAVNYYAAVPASNFKSSVYTEVFLSIRGAAGLMSFSDEYTDMADSVCDKIEEIGEKRAAERLAEIQSDAYAAIREGLKELDEQENAALIAFDEGERQLEEGGLALRKAGRDLLMYQPEALQSGNDPTARERRELPQKADELAIQRETTKELFAAERERLLAAAASLDELSRPEWYALSRETNLGYSGYGQDAEKIEAIGKVFPLIFFIVAALVSLTTMTRLVEERRVEIGTLKSLGYGSAQIMSKYVIYAMSPTLLGGLLGGYIGMILFPRTIISAYTLMYKIPEIFTPVSKGYWLLGIGMAVLFTLAATLASLMAELRSPAASLMRPKPPKVSKRTLIESIKPLWNRLSFTRKVTARNIMRYKKRLFMTVIGIGGCTALLMTGFGLRDSIADIVDLHFGKVFKQDIIISFTDGASRKDLDEVHSVMNESRAVRSSLVLFQKSMDAGVSGTFETANLVVPENGDEIYDFISLKERGTGKKHQLSDDGVIVSEKLAILLNAAAGDEIYIDNGDKRVFVTVLGVAENYYMHNIYMTRALYESKFGEAPTFNTLYAFFGEGGEAARDSLANEVLGKSGVAAFTFVQKAANAFKDTIKSLNFVVFVLIASAAALAFVVLLNLTNININERVREIATIEVLGFYDEEVSSYIFRENVVLTILGTGLGLVMGIFLHMYVIRSVEIDIIMFGRIIKPLSYVFSIALTFIFALFVNLISARKLSKIDMVEALKSVE